jgi:hypothetical protein
MKKTKTIPLVDIKKEKIAQALAKGYKKSAAYAMSFPNASKKTASSCASTYISNNPEVVYRAIDLVRKSEGTSLPRILKKLEEKLDCTKPYGKSNLLHDDNSNQIIAAQTLLKLHGELREENYIDNREININASPQLINSLSEVLARLEAMRNVPQQIPPAFTYTPPNENDAL